MDPITFILGIASAVLSGVITDLVTKKKKAATQEEIDKEIARQLLYAFRKRSGGLRPPDLDRIRQIVLDEIRVLLMQNPNFEISNGEIALKNPPKKPLLASHDQFIQQELQAQLHQMDEVINRRRLELGLPGPGSASNLAAAGAQNVQGRENGMDANFHSVSWRQAGTKSAGSQSSQPEWVQELERRIAERRSGEKLGDKQ